MKRITPGILTLSLLCVFAALRCLFPDPSIAQVRAVYDMGRTGLEQKLKRLQTNKSVLMIGAHPDDEDTALLTYLARGENARTAYLSLTRGDGGQNVIGEELFEALGVIRTEELLQARRLDGAEQFFTRAFDFGFSKSLVEARKKWDEKVILCDVVGVIRDFRPLVVVSQFNGTPTDGHGQHQFAGYIAPIAVKAAADGSQCEGEPWQVKKFYVRHRGQGEPTLRINTGRYDPLLGRSYFEIAMEARSQHKSQEQGVLELRGDQFSALKRVGSETQETSIFEGLETGAAVPKFNLDDTAGLIRSLAEMYPSSDRKQEVAETIAAAAGLRIDALADSETIVADEPLIVGVKAYAASDLIKVKDVAIGVPYGWAVSPEGAPKTNSPANVLREATPYARFFRVTAPSQSQFFTQPYWLKEPRNGDIFRWGETSEVHSTPFGRRPLIARVTVEVAGKEIVLERDVQFRYADDIRGEIRREIDFVPRLNVEMDEPLVLVTTSGKPQTKRVTMTVTNLSNGPTAGMPSIYLDSDYLDAKTITPRFEIARKGEKTSLAWDITIAANTPPGRYSIEGEARVGDTFFKNRMWTVAYPHIQTHRFYTLNKLDFQVIDLKVAPVKVGYIMGSGDKVPDAIRRMGIDVTMIDEKMLSTGDLARFDTIVVGVRASQVRPDMVANNSRLNEFMRRGGTLIVQYQQQEYVRNNLPPYPAKMDTNIRVTDENAQVRILQPQHPVFNYPNKIVAADWDNWVQERNLYSFSDFDAAHYLPLLESHDEGEPERTGGMVYADVGKGKYIYTAYSWFRQLPAGNPGAYRIFANMLSLPKTVKGGTTVKNRRTAKK